jgi:hypothetical protein
MIFTVKNLDCLNAEGAPRLPRVTAQPRLSVWHKVYTYEDDSGLIFAVMNHYYKLGI